MLWLLAVARAASPAPPHLLEWVSPVYPDRPVLCVGWVDVGADGSAELSTLSDDSAQETSFLAEKTAIELIQLYQAGKTDSMDVTGIWRKYERELASCPELRPALVEAVEQWRFTSGSAARLTVQFHHDPRNPTRVTRRVAPWTSADRAAGYQCVAEVEVDGQGQVTGSKVTGCPASAATVFEAALGEWTFEARGEPWAALYAGAIPAAMATRRNVKKEAEWFPGDGYDDGTCWVVVKVLASGKAELLDTRGCRGSSSLDKDVARWRFQRSEADWVLVNAVPRS